MDFEIRKVRSPQGRKKLSAERAAYFQLMQQGVSNEDACRIIGVNPKTGRRWGNGRIPSGRNNAAPPVRPVAPPSASSLRYLSQDERIYIADRIREKAPVRAIAAELGRGPSTISREIRLSGSELLPEQVAEHGREFRRPELGVRSGVEPVQQGAAPLLRLGDLVEGEQVQARHPGRRRGQRLLGTCQQPVG